jgi:asparagine synthase (glutamine-hydrolysing)
MCGILGYFSPEGISDALSAIRGGMSVASYRGPDDAGLSVFRVEGSSVRHLGSANGLDFAKYWEGPAHLALGHLRLSIIDLSAAGHQPMASDDGEHWITYNGEVYNYLELREELERAGVRFRSHSDTEVIVQAYRAWGTRCVERFVGMWSFLLLDARRRTLFCSRDRFGIKPLHYLYDGTRLIVASEIKQILEFPSVPRRVNKQSAFEYLLHGSTDHSAETMFQGIMRLEPGHNLEFSLVSRQIAISRYYNHTPRIDNEIGFKEAARRFHDLFSESVRLHLRSDVEVGSCLSGGLDSSSIVCLVHDQLSAEGKSSLQRTFSCHFDEAEANELEYMQEVIRATGVAASFTRPGLEQLMADLPAIVWHQEEPFGSTSIFAQWSVFKLVKEQGVKVMLDGQGADEQLAGYIGLGWYYMQELLRKREYSRLVKEAGCYLARHGGDALSVLGAVPMLRPLLALRPKLPSIQWIDPKLTDACAPHNMYLANTKSTPYADTEILNNALAQLTWRNNIPTLLRYEDRNSMAFSVEARVPFLDHRLVEFVMSLPSHFKIRRGFTKRVLRDGMAGVLPEKIRWRVSKLGFATPEQTWQATALKPLIENALQSGRLEGFVDAGAARKYFEELLQTPLKDFAPWRWVNLQLWLDRYGIQG